MFQEVRDILVKHPKKMKLMWVPEHSGIKGNEYANKATFIFSTSVKTDSIRKIDIHMRTAFKNDWTKLKLI